MRYIFILGFALMLVHADKWKINRNPFTVSDHYIEKTQKVYLVPKNNYIPFNIELLGISHSNKAKEAILNIEFEGVRNIRLNETIVVNTPDIQSHLQIKKIAERYVVISVNKGEGIRYDIK